MEILFITPEIVPYSRSGEVGDVCAALPKALRAIGHKVTVISPLWGSVDASARGLARRLSGVEVKLGAARHACTLHDGRTTGGVELVFVGQPELFAGAPGEGSPEARLLAALAFAQAAAQVAAMRQPVPDVLHAHHWFAGAALALAQPQLPAAVRVFSLHDVRDPGRLDALGPGITLPDGLREFASSGPAASLLQVCAASAERVVASSQHEAHALLEQTGVLAETLRAEGKLIGIANGLDAARWNPVTDPLLPARFDPVDLSGKARGKAALQLELGLPVLPDVPLVVQVSSAANHAQTSARLPEIESLLLRNDLQALVLASEAQQAEALRALSEQYPERLRVIVEADERMRHRAVAAADFVVITDPSAHEGDTHLAAQRYGALPIARKVGAVADGVVDCEASLATGSGFIYEGDEPADLSDSVQRALAAFSHARAFDTLRRRVMKQDVSWERSARRYEHVYRSLKSSSQ